MIDKPELAVSKCDACSFQSHISKPGQLCPWCSKGTLTSDLTEKSHICVWVDTGFRTHYCKVNGCNYVKDSKTNVIVKDK